MIGIQALIPIIFLHACMHSQIYKCSLYVNIMPSRDWKRIPSLHTLHGLYCTLWLTESIGKMGCIRHAYFILNWIPFKPSPARGDAAVSHQEPVYGNAHINTWKVDKIDLLNVLYWQCISCKDYRNLNIIKVQKMFSLSARPAPWIKQTECSPICLKDY